MADQNETIKLLKECDAGVKMGIQSLEDVLTGLKDGNLKNILQQSKERHEEIKRHIDKYLKEYQEDGKEPAAIATMMAKMKEGFKMMTEESSCAAANLIISGRVPTIIASLIFPFSFHLGYSIDSLLHNRLKESIWMILIQQF